MMTPPKKKKKTTRRGGKKGKQREKKRKVMAVSTPSLSSWDELLGFSESQFYDWIINALPVKDRSNQEEIKKLRINGELLSNLREEEIENAFVQAKINTLLLTKMMNQFRTIPGFPAKQSVIQTQGNIFFLKSKFILTSKPFFFKISYLLFSLPLTGPN
jgi:hypothetical protein